MATKKSSRALHKFYRQIAEDGYQYTVDAVKQRKRGKNLFRSLDEETFFKRKLERNDEYCYRMAVLQAEKRNKEWKLTFEEYLGALGQGACYYCGNGLSVSGVGLDRKDNKLGYVPGNVVACCGPCNMVKGMHLTFDEMVIAMKAVVAFRSRG